jgi:cytochrome c
MFRKKKLVLVGCLLLIASYLLSCDDKPEQRETRKPIEYIKRIPGKDDSIPPQVSAKGKVLIAYSDCYTCHKEDQRSVGPSFTDIAKRYPANKVYIEMLAQKVIVGGSRNWGYPVMDPHPKLSLEDAKMMVSYILSMEK